MKKVAPLRAFVLPLLAVTAAVIALAFTFSRWQRPPAYTDACLDTENNIVICAASNMARYSKHGPIELEHEHFSLAQLSPTKLSEDATTDEAINKAGTAGHIQIDGARNETVGFQLILRKTDKAAPSEISVELASWKNADTNQDAAIKHQLLRAHYHLVDKGGYTWGPKSDLLPWPAEYPDALIPQQHGCFGETKTVFDTIALSPEADTNQAVWIDNYIPASTPPGNYTLTITLKVEQSTIPISVDLTVHNATLPDKPSIDSIGEIYRSYNLEGAGFDRSDEQWQRMAQCYQQLAHAHRMVFMERWPEIPEGDALENYINTYQPLFDGSLFTKEYGYSGPGEDTAVSIWRTPWPQEYNVELENPLQQSDFQRYTALSKDWKALTNQLQWNNTRFFAYVFDEVDGPLKKGNDTQERYDYIAMVHAQMGLLQRALDTGTEDKSLDLLWTSHSNPSQWQHDEKLNLANKVRLWSPNASAADPSFLGERIQAGETAWFYHSGHPAVGVHSVNASGIEMRTWGVIGARYGFNGQFMWAVNLGNDDKPFAEPTYKPDDDRFGNGVVVYPGNQLDKLNFPATPGPLPSMRLKAWRRGLQDAELYYLAREKDQKAADELIQTMVPNALADGEGKASWSNEPSDWIEFKRRLLELASR